MQIEMQLLPGTQLQPTAARVRVNEVVDGLNQLAERLAAGEAFDMSCYDLAVVEGFKVPLTQQQTVDLVEAVVAIQLSQDLHLKVDQEIHLL